MDIRKLAEKIFAITNKEDSDLDAIEAVEYILSELKICSCPDKKSTLPKTIKSLNSQ